LTAAPLKPSPFAADGTLLRGEALVELVIAHVLSGKAAFDVPQPRPMSPDLLAALTFSDGSPIPPSLRRWLSFDATYWMQRFHHFHDPQAPRLQVISWGALARRGLYAEPALAAIYAELDTVGASSPLLRLETSESEDSVEAVYPGRADEHGEFPVVTVGSKKELCVAFRAGGLDIFLAEISGLIDKKDKKDKLLAKALDEAMRQHAAVFKDALALEYQGRWIGMDARGKTVWEGPELEPEPSEDREPEDFAPGDPPVFVIDKPVPAMAEDRLAKQLVKAISVRDRSRTEWLLPAAIERFPQGEWRDEALLEAAGKGPVSLVRRLLDAGADPDVSDYRTALGNAVEYRQLETMQVLIDAGADVDAAGSSGAAPLGDACANRHLKGAKLLVESGAEPNCCDNRKNPALGVIVEHLYYPEPATSERVRLLELMLDAGADINGSDEVNKMTALHYADDPEFIEVLLRRGANPSLPDYRGMTPFMSHWAQDDLPAVRRFLPHSPRLDIAREDGLRIADCAWDDALTPRELDVAYRASGQPQMLDLSFDMRVWETTERRDHMGLVLERLVEKLVAMADAGALGGDRFSPADCSAELVSSSAPSKAPGKLHHFEARLRVAGLAPDALCAVAESWIRPFHYSFVRRLVVRGELPLDDSPDSLNTDRMREWLRDPPRMGQFEPLPFAVEHVGTKLRVRVDIAGARAHEKALLKAGNTWSEVVEAITRTGVRWSGEAKCTPDSTGATLHLSSYGPGAAVPGLDEVLPPLLGILGKLVANGVPITRVAAG
jgi:ankyrin repeat protein